MKRNEIEQDAENEIIRELKSLGLFAFHAQIAKDGFPDIIAIGSHRIVLIEMKFDRRKYGSKICDIMEPSQPIFFENVHNAGYDFAYLCVFNGETYSLYRTNNMLSMSMNGMHVWHLDRAFEGEFTPEDMAQKIARIANGRQV
jgi:hypothetical protein